MKQDARRNLHKRTRLRKRLAMKAYKAEKKNNLVDRPPDGSPVKSA